MSRIKLKYFKFLSFQKDIERLKTKRPGFPRSENKRFNWLRTTIWRVFWSWLPMKTHWSQVRKARKNSPWNLRAWSNREGLWTCCTLPWKKTVTKYRRTWSTTAAGSFSWRRTRIWKFKFHLLLRPAFTFWSNKDTWSWRNFCS